MKRTTLLLIFVTLFYICSASSIWAQEGYSPETLFVTIFADGSVQIEYSIIVDDTFARVNVSLFGVIYENLIILNENYALLDYSPTEGGIIVDTLGSLGAKITYNTSDLVNKTGRTWSLIIQAPIEFIVKLPKDATIVSLSEVPLAIKSIGGQYILTMPEGRQEIGYIIGVVGTKEYALLIIQEAERMINEIKDQGIIVSEAESKLDSAKIAYNEGKYVDAEQLANQAMNLALQTYDQANLAEQAINAAEIAIMNAEAEGKTSNLDQARNSLQTAKSEFALGKYQQSYQSALLSKAQAKTSSTSAFLSSTYGILALGIGIITIPLLVFIILRLRSVKPPSTIQKEIRKIDVNRIFESKPQLRPEDREAIMFIAESGGEAFEAELREKFQLPRTTIWRMVKRLQREGVIEVRKIGGQNLIRLL